MSEFGSERRSVPMSRDIVPKQRSKTIGRTITTNMVLNGTGPDKEGLEQIRALIGQDVEVSYRINMSVVRTMRGKLVGLADRASTANPPDLVIKNRSKNLTLINTLRIVKLISTMEALRVWDLNPMELARIGYEAWKDSLDDDSLMDWVDLSHAEREHWLSCSEAVRDAVTQGI